VTVVRAGARTQRAFYVLIPQLNCMWCGVELGGVWLSMSTGVVEGCRRSTFRRQNVR
jgi:hypothetical protein